jgi:phosphatidylglycerophosphate synthase
MHIWIDARSPSARDTIYSIPVVERLLRQLHTLGIRRDVTVILPPDITLERIVRADFRPRFTLELTTAHTAAPCADLLQQEQDAEHAWLLLEGHGIYDERILRTLLQSASSLVITNRTEGTAPLAVVIQARDRHRLPGAAQPLRTGITQGIKDGWLPTLAVEEMDSYIPSLRQTAVPMLRALGPHDDKRALENVMYEHTFKGAMDVIATYIYRIPVRGLVRWLAPTRVTPNHVTAVSVLCSFLAIPLFVTGWFLAGLLVAFTFIICDSLDGKLARLTIRLSDTAGHVDHITSPLFEACYYLGWGWYFTGGTFAGTPGTVSWLLFGFFGFDRIITSAFGQIYRRSLLDYKPWDARFHLIAARRNTNLAMMLLGCLVQQPLGAMYVLTVWMGITMLWHLARFAVHASGGRRPRGQAERE